MLLEELQRLILKGESERLEFKRSTGQRTEAAKTLCALLNGLGGFVVFGVTDTGELVGQTITSKTLEDIALELKRIDPPVFPEIKTISINDDKGIIIIRVHGEQGIYTFDHRPYLRHGPTTQIMPKNEYMQRLFAYLHATRRWENEPCPDSVKISDLDDEEIHATLQMAIDAGRIDKPQHTDTKSILTGFNLIHENKLLNAAVVLYGKAQKLQSLYPQLSIRLARFKGEDRLGDFLDNRQYWGNAFLLLKRAESFLYDHMPIAGRVLSGKMRREDYPMYPPRAIREAVANSICHRDYANPGDAVTIAMYTSHLEIANPGSFHFGISPEKLTKPHPSRPWNPLIAEVFYRTGIIEKWGTGTLNIINWCKGNGNPPPKWEEQSGYVVNTFLSQQTIVEEQSRLESRLESGLESGLESNRASLKTSIFGILKDRDLSRAEIAARLGHKGISGGLNKALKEMLEEGSITYTRPEKPGSRMQTYKLQDNTDQYSKD